MKIGKVEITHPDKKLFPEITKREFIEYYNRISKKMLPFLKDRPLVMKRYPNNITKQGFFQKEMPDYFPNYIDSVKVNQKQGGKKQYPVVNNKEALIYIANQDCIEFHIWLSNNKLLEKPDKIIFDLDPSKGFVQVYEGAKALKKILDNLKLNSFLMSTGSRGVHVIVPIKQELEFEKVKDIADKIAEKVVKENKEFTREVRKNKRRGRLLIDTARNSYAQTGICPYSTRPTKFASIAAPLSWKQLKKDFNPQKFTIKNIPAENPWKGFHKIKNSIKNLKLG